jgi:hypothetical protein
MVVSHGAGWPSAAANASLAPNMQAITAVTSAIADRYPEASIRIGIPKLLPDVMDPGSKGFDRHKPREDRCPARAITF